MTKQKIYKKEAVVLNSDQKTKVVIGFCTYDRLDDLSLLLDSLTDLQIPEGIDATILVVDNDVERTAEAAVNAFADLSDIPVRYEVEPTPGIPFARNRVLNEAGETGYLAFIDDDETVDANWLEELIIVARETKAHFVQGPVVMTVADRKDDWWLKSTFFKPKTFADRALRHESWTNNVLIDLSFVTEHSVQFDQALQFDGGADTLFFQDMVAAGAVGRFAANARVYEVQKPSRLTWKWALMRQYRYGITRAQTVLLRRRWGRALGYCVVRGGAMLVLGLLSLAKGLVKGRAGLADGLALIARGTGVFAGAFGGRRREYAR